MTDEWEYLRQATHAREKALLADSAAKAEWLKLANLWETLALEYYAFREMQSGGTAGVERGPWTFH
jgi:hypothetical protein